VEAAAAYCPEALGEMVDRLGEMVDRLGEMVDRLGEMVVCLEPASG
jgi:hypothetical protein